MNVDNYDLYYITQYDSLEQLKQENTYDLFISAYNNEGMVRDVYNTISANTKLWLLLPDYTDIKIEEITNEYYSNNLIHIDDNDLESQYINTFIETYKIYEYKEKSICIDITGFVKPYMIYLIFSLTYLGFKKIEIIYSEPKIYKNQEETEFSEEEIITTRNINGFDKRTREKPNDLFIINAGYDHRLLINVAGFKKNIKNKKILLGFPSLQPIMYQENILNLQKAGTELHIDHEFKPLYAAANDPFDTAKIIKDYIITYSKKHSNFNTVYLAPLATKAQALGMIVFYILEKDFFREKEIDIKIIYPFTKSYSSSAGKELFRINKYSLEF